METQIKKWGNSLAVRIPAELAKDAGLSEDANVEMNVESGRIVIKPIPKYTLEELLAQVTDDNIHGEIDFGKPVGKEIL